MWWRKPKKNIVISFEIDKDGNFYVKCDWPNTKGIEYKDLVALVQHSSNMLHLLTAGNANQILYSAIVLGAKKHGRAVDLSMANALVNQLGELSSQSFAQEYAPVVPATEVF